ncbi:MAG: hypothetical protein H6924_04295 [Alphaproteobacteria bacterium]|nr:hypothetical protein [Alphaproteobacteria bacterium]
MTDVHGSPDRRAVLATMGAAAVASPALAAPVVAAPVVAATSVRETRLNGRDALTLSNGRMQLSVLPGGGFIGEVRLNTGRAQADVNPMRVPHYPTIDPYAFDYDRDGDRYGTDVQARLMAGYMGHFTCFPQFGNQPEEFKAADYNQHGEALAVKWQRQSAPADTLSMQAELPRTRYRFSRDITMLPDETVAYVTESATNLMIQDRPLQWVQHVTMGPPFAAVGRMYVDASVDRVVLGAGNDARLGDWPQSPNAAGAMHDYRVFSGDTGYWLMQRTGHNWFVAYNTDLKLLFAHVWDASVNPWLLDWQQNKTNLRKPWDGKAVARGLCWGDSLIQGAKNAVVQGSNFGVPQYSWIDSLATRRQRYAILLTEMPAGWQGAAALTTADGAITITEKNGGRTLRIKASRI